MPLMMVGPLFLLLASAASAPTASPAPEAAASYRQNARATASATATIRIVSGVRFGQDYQADDPAANRRKTQLTDSAGQIHPAELLEFQ